MALVAISTLYPNIVPFVAGCPSPIIRQAVRDAAREFCIDSRVWRATLAPINVGANTSNYTLAAPNSSAAVLEADAVRYNNEPLSFLTKAQLDADYPDWRIQVGTPEVFTVLTPGTITLVPKPATALTAGLEVDAILIPSTTATSVDDSITTRWSTNLSAGALALIVAMPRQPWTAPSDAIGYYNLFRDGIRKASTAAAASFQSRPHRVVKYGGL